MWVELGILCVLLLTYLWLSRPKRPPNFPPGPPTFLMFGNVYHLLKAATQDFLVVAQDVRSQYKSDVVGFVSASGLPIVHVFGADLIKQACSQTQFSGRPSLFPPLYLNFMQKIGVLFSEGPLWQEHRRFSLKHLRDLGLGKNTLNTAIADEYDHLAKYLKKQVGQPMKANKLFTTTVLNIMWKMIADKRYDFDDPERIKLRKVVEGFTRFAGPQSMMVAFPWIRFVAPEWSGFRGLQTFRDETSLMFSRIIQEHREVLDVNNPRDFVDAFLIEMQKPDAKGRGFTELNLMSTGVDFFIAGSETTSLAMTWSMLLLVRFPDVQTKVQQELDSVLGDSGHPGYEDRARLPYTEAVINEVFRFSCFVGTAVPHHTSQGPAQLAGYTIPKDSVVIMHLHSAHKDPSHWGDPDVFRPERFLDEDGKFRKDDFLMPFGVGKRACLGESLARMEFFVFFCCLFRQFRLRLPEGSPPPPLQYRFTILCEPDDFYIIPELRGSLGDQAAPQTARANA